MQYIQTCGILWPLLKGYKTAEYLNKTQQQQKTTNNTKSEEQPENDNTQQSQQEDDNNNTNDKLSLYTQQLSTITTSAQSLKQLYPLVVAPTRWYVNGSYSTALAMMKLESMFNDKFESMNFTYEKPTKSSSNNNNQDGDDNTDDNKADEIPQDYSLSHSQCNI
eukprot:UN03100